MMMLTMLLLILAVTTRNKKSMMKRKEKLTLISILMNKSSISKQRYCVVRTGEITTGCSKSI